MSKKRVNKVGARKRYCTICGVRLRLSNCSDKEHYSHCSQCSNLYTIFSVIKRRCSSKRKLRAAYRKALRNAGRYAALADGMSIKEAILRELNRPYLIYKGPESSGLDTI